jgi:uncharacterized protein (TIGR03435 family)
MIGLTRSVFSAVLLAGLVSACAQDKAAQPLAPMARDADPSFEVATIKPSDPNDTNYGFRIEGRQIHVEANTLTNIISFAYSVQKVQIINAPKWFDEQRWDIDGVPDIAGKPSWVQYKKMLQKLLVARFGLQMHHDKRELAVYVLTVAKNGPKLEKTKSDPSAMNDASGHGIGAAQYMKFTNESMADLAQVFEIVGGEKPVVDQTNLSGRYDFTLTWTPDSIRAAEPNAPPSLFTAVQEQLGLKLESTHAPADVLIVEAATQPTEN